MENTVDATTRLRRIDIERFFQVLSGKLGKEDLELVSAAMAESVATERGLRRVVSCSAIDPARLSQVRSQLREKSSDLGRDELSSSIRDGKPLS